ncbi:hypothetical protein Sru01_45620 [Sphaerisporangium rufum]|uniref:Esterase-like activity of phytase family protein n=1 Tax=Sphaerisporangium rufum TaxID=1381558 RepID=A0A919R932_9ACTN|nr:hypothetical protein Sru01_45620 [Sphaerisporangium rufum]
MAGVLGLLAVLAPPVPARAAGRDVAAARDPGATGGSAERLLFRFRDPRITESSGLAVSPTHKGIVYTHNDSGSGPRFYAVGPDGRTRAAFTVAGAAARDWEAMAASIDPATGQSHLWFADIGDNFDGAWPDYSIYRVPEPRTLRDATVRATRYRFRYHDGPRNAEGMMVHPRTGRVYVVSKEFAGSIYAAPTRLRTDRVNILRRVGSAPIMATDAAYAPDGSGFVIRTYFSASLYRAPDKLITRLTMPPLRQAESITYTSDGQALLTGSEGPRSPVHLVPLPESAAARPAGSPSAARERSRPSRVPGVPDAAATGTSMTAGDAGVPAGVIAAWLAVALGATGIIALIARRAR